MTNKDIIKKAIELDTYKIPELLAIVGDNDNVILIKSDGLRLSLRYTVIILGVENKFEMIRFDSNSLNESLNKVLRQYIEYL